jgi:hypothetical protein
LVIEYGNRPSSTKGQKEVIYEPRIVLQKGVDLDTKGNNSSVERTDKNAEKNNNFPDRTCDCCLNNSLKLGIIIRSDDDCSKCCDTMQTCKNTSDSVSSESDTTEAVNMSAADLTAEDSSRSVKQDGHNSSSLDNTTTSVTPLSR